MPTKMNPVDVFSPAKINLFLAVTGRRADGFHDLVSVVAPLDFGDGLRVESAADGVFTLECDHPEVPLGEANLVLRAARLFKEATGWPGGARFILKKNIPMGAGLGGGSSNATAALLALNRLAGQALPSAVMAGLAARLGSDCPLFLHDGPVVMRGRGERIEPLPAAASERLRGQRLLIFKPSFGINTTWAYAQMAAEARTAYVSATEAEARLGAWVSRADAPVSELLFNNMERAAFAKYVALPTLLDRLRGDFGVAAAMSGSGSACFALLEKHTPVSDLLACIQNAWSDHLFVVEAKIG